MQVPVGDEKVPLWARKSSELNLKCGTVGIILNCNRLKGAQHGLLPVLPAWDRSLLVRVAYPGFISNTSKKMMTVQPNGQTNHSRFLETGKKKEIKNPLSFTMNNSTDPKHQLCFWGGFETTTPRGQALTALSASPGLRPCPATSGAAPLHPPGASPCRAPLQTTIPIWQRKGQQVSAQHWSS